VAVVLYELYLHFCGLSLRSVSKALEHVFPRSHTAEWIHVIVMESHIGTHVEASAHWIDSAENREGAGKDITQVPLASYFGEAILIK